jgi:branched-chain amino acid transport system substrate-binding protein
MSGRSRSIAGSLAVVVLLAGGSASADIQIGLAGPMTGDYSVFGEQMKNGAQMAVVDINATGGINGENLVLTIASDRCDPRTLAVSRGLSTPREKWCQRR